jgi:uncharacterized membrane protein YfcA
VGGAGGAVLGQWLAPHLPDRRLRQGFSALLIGSALLTGAEAWRRHESVAPAAVPAAPVSRSGPLATSPTPYAHP